MSIYLNEFYKSLKVSFAVGTDTEIKFSAAICYGTEKIAAMFSASTARFNLCHKFYMILLG